MKTALIIGYGSIGARHCRVLRDMGLPVSVVSRHLQDADFPVYGNIDAAFSHEHFDYAVIATPTAEHRDTLRRLAPHVGVGDTVLCEKPIFGNFDGDIPELRAALFVGYVLRAHPLLRKVKDLTFGKKLFSCSCSCGQYLPDWRPGTDYRNSYSAKKIAGGGVLRDISHELDYLQMIAGDWTSACAMGGKVSSLEIDSDDQFGILFTTEKCPLCECHLDYLSRRVHRDLRVEFEDGTLHFDFISNTLHFNDQTWTVKLERDDMFRTMHAEVLANDATYMATLDDALKTLQLIEAAEKSAKEKKWLENR